MLAGSAIRHVSRMCLNELLVTGCLPRYFGHTQVWDDGLGYLLGPSLFAYEQERVDGASFGSGDFQDAVQGAVPDG